MSPRQPQKHRPANDHGHDHGDQARAMLKDHGLRVTDARLAVLKTLLDNHRPTSAQELIEALASQGLSNADDVTVYRIVNVLVEEGIAKQVGTTDRGRRFEVHACEGCRVDHPHLECRRCGKLECLEQGVLPGAMIPTEVGGYLIDEAKLYLYGLCPTCRQAPSPRRTRRET